VDPRYLCPGPKNAAASETIAAIAIVRFAPARRSIASEHRVIGRKAKALRVHPILLTLAMVLYSGYQRITRRFAPRFLTGIPAIAVMLAAFSAIPAFATTYTVTSLADSGAGSLRNAIASAASGYTINFSLAYPATTLASTLTINTSLTISGPGASNVAISGNSAVEVFSISGGITVNISGVTIENGRSIIYTSGGGIVNGATLALNNVTLSGNSATYYGGIYNQGTLTAKNNIVASNFWGELLSLWNNHFPRPQPVGRRLVRIRGHGGHEQHCRRA
jgi:hypothetical protein